MQVSSSSSGVPGHAKGPAVAGLFYPAETGRLQQDVDRYLAQADAQPGLVPKALIVPHAGYIYSGPVAAYAYRQLEFLVGPIETVLMLGPAHRVAFPGLAVHSADYFSTPLGRVPLDRALLRDLSRLPFVHPLDQAFGQEHCLEVQLPFLQRLLPGFKLAPLLIGQSDYQQVAQVLEQVADDPRVLIVISSDLSHYHRYEEAQRLDADATRAIEGLNPSGLHYEHACGRIGIGGLLLLARQRGWRVRTLNLRNSGDTAGPRDQVVGYGSYVLF